MTATLKTKARMRNAAIIGLAATLATISGCSSADSAQSRAEACQVASSSVKQTREELQTSITSMGFDKDTDLASVIANIAHSVEKVYDDIRNETVQAELEPVLDIVASIAEDPRGVSTIITKVDALNDAISEFDEFCKN